MRFGSTAKVLAECDLKYYRISECDVPLRFASVIGIVHAKEAVAAAAAAASAPEMDICALFCTRQSKRIDKSLVQEKHEPDTSRRD